MTGYMHTCPSLDCRALTAPDQTHCSACGRMLGVLKPKAKARLARAKVRKPEPPWNTCVYCGRPIHKRSLTCHAHTGLVRIDPFYAEDVA